MRKLVISALALAALAACAQQQPAELTQEQLVARGDYLVNGVVLCGDCHTPRFEDMTLDETRKLQGGRTGAPPPQSDIAPQIAGIPTNYTEEQFIAFLQTGIRPDGSHPLQPMPPYRLNEEDARAVVAYVATLPRANAASE